MLKRILFGTLMTAAVAALLVVDWYLQYHRPRLELPGGIPILGIPVALAVFALLLKAFMELGRLSSLTAVRLLPVSGIAGAVALGMFPFWRQFFAISFGAPAVMAMLGLLIILVFVEQMLRGSSHEAFRGVAATLLAVFYLGVSAGMTLQIRFSFGVPALAFFLAVVKLTDIAAYFVGSAIGRHKLLPRVSPGKSWEGLLGGLIVAAGAGMLAVAILGGIRGGHHLALVPLWQAAVFGIIIALAGQFADLCESLLKRSAGVKDSGATVPEFGGVLDIVDSVLLASPVAYLLLAAVSP
ncbi:MAG: phosphatidate cytidylyltransferase [Planctomycetota bacterium]|jgi:phosphatidate cytidylyltransferase